MSDRDRPLTAEIAWGTGYLVGYLWRMDIEVVPITDDEGNYTDEMQVRIQHPDHHYPDMYARLRVLGWEER